MAKETMKLKGFDLVVDPETGKPGDILEPHCMELEYEMPYSEPSADAGQKNFRLGMPVTLRAFNKMIARYQSTGSEFIEDKRNLITILKKYPLGFEISKTSLIRILAQEDVEIIRIWFALPFDDEDVKITLQGVDKNKYPTKYQTIKDAIDSDGNTAPHDKSHPLLEEQVTPITKLLMAEFFNEENKDKNLKDFIINLYEYLANQ